MIIPVINCSKSDLNLVVADGLNNFKVCPLMIDVVAGIKKLELYMSTQYSKRNHTPLPEICVCMADISSCIKNCCMF